MPGTSYLLRARSERTSNSCSETVPILSFLSQAFSSRSSEFVKLGAAIVLGCSPACFEKPLTDQTEQRGIERSLLNEERLPGDLADAQKNSVAMQGPHGNCLQDEEIECAGKKLGLICHAIPPKLFRRLSQSLLSCQGERAGNRE